MPASAIKKTKSERSSRLPKDVLPALVVLCCFLIAIICVRIIVAGNQTTQACTLSIWNPSAVNLDQSYTGECILLETVATPELRQKGLSGRVSMPVNQGMLFVFDEPGDVCFWMKEMHFGLDMIWVDGSQQVVQIDSGVLPETYPDRFCSPSPVQYVIELNQGMARATGIKNGDLIAL